MAREWKPGDLAMWEHEGRNDGREVVMKTDRGWSATDGPLSETLFGTVRLLVVIDPDSDDDLDRLCKALVEKMYAAGDRASAANGVHPATMLLALREFAAPKPVRPEEPTDPTARITDRRDCVWRLLADGDWICVDGPDIGEYLNWDHLSSERGPLEVQS